MEMMARQSNDRMLAPRFWAGVVTMPLLARCSAPWASSAAGWSAYKMIGSTTARSGADPGRYDVWKDVGNSPIKTWCSTLGDLIALQQGCEASYYDARRRLARPPHRGDVASLDRTGLDFILTAMMFAV